MHEARLSESQERKRGGDRERERANCYSVILLLQCRKRMREEMLRAWVTVTAVGMYICVGGSANGKLLNS